MAILWFDKENWRQTANELTKALREVSRVAEKLDERNADTLRLAEDLIDHIRKQAV